jgi:hypothetical protein
MASVLVNTAQAVEAHGFPAFLQRRSTLTAGLEENVAHGGPTGTGSEPIYVTSTTVVSPTTGDPVLFTWVKAGTSTTNGTVRVKWDTVPGGSLTGAEVELKVQFPCVKGGGITAP